MLRLSTAVLVALSAAGGCSPSDAPTPRATASAARSAGISPDEALDPAAARPIAAAADSFMRGVLAGDAAQAAGLLTTTASKRYAADPTILQSFGMQVERFAVGEVRLLSPAEAAAQCLVTEKGAPAPQELCCLLKLEAAGWRVCGLACDAPGSVEPAVINFEDPPGSATPPQRPANAQFVEQETGGGVVPRTAADPARGEIR